MVLAAPSGEMRLRRYALVGVIDVWSRRVMYQLAPVSSSAAITQLLRRALLRWGVPEKLRLDNGRDYASERVALLAGALAIRIEHCRPFHPEEKPFIERTFRTVSVAMEMLPGYVGHSVAERQQLRARERARVRAGEAPVDLGYRRLEWKCDALNAPSRRAAKRFGFTYEGHFRRNVIICNRSRDTAWFSMLSEEWSVLKPAYEKWLAPDNFDEQGRQKTKLRELTWAVLSMYRGTSKGTATGM